jgi:hypothetical protein
MLFPMFAPLVAALALQASPAPAPTPALTPTPLATGAPSRLKEIGHVSALSACDAIVVHANSAIDDALADDSDLAILVNHLSTSDLKDADNIFKRKKILDDLSTLASRIRVTAKQGGDQIHYLRQLSAQSTDPTRKVELKAFAEALGSALYRQERDAEHITRMVAIIDGREQTSGIRSDFDPYPIPTDPFDNPQTRDQDIITDAAGILEKALQLVNGDEGTAADHSLGATSGC